MATRHKWAAPELPSWFPTAAQEERARQREAVEAPMRPWSPEEDRALRAIEGKRGMVKVLAIALGRAPGDLYRRRYRLQLLDERTE
jgi:hypothetical protein